MTNVNQVKILIRSLSVNQAWRGGRRFKTKEYKEFERTLGFLLPIHYPIPPSNLHLSMEVGFSNERSDLSNAIKAFEDVLQTYYNFDDNRVYKITMEKRIVKKGEEYITFSIESAV